VHFALREVVDGHARHIASLVSLAHNTSTRYTGERIVVLGVLKCLNTSLSKLRETQTT
jgi:hypothetical protein